MTALNPNLLPNERLSKLEQRMDFFERQHDTIAAKVDEMHAIMLQAKGAKWAVAALWLAIMGSGGTIGWVLAHWK